MTRPQTKPTHDYDYPWPWQQRDVLYDLRYNEHMTNRDIAIELGCATSTVEYWLDKHDLTFDGTE